MILCCPVSGSCVSPCSPTQYIDAISSKQGELENHVSDGYKTALTEERRRFCFLVEKQCAVAKNSAACHSKVRPAGRGHWLPGGRRGRVHGEPCGKEHRAFQIPQGPRSGRRVTGSDTADVFEGLVRNCQLLFEDGGRRLAPRAGLQCQGSPR